MNTEYIHVYSASGYLAGEMIRLLLESMNIPAVCSQESVGASYGLTLGALGEVKVYVPADRVNEAKEVLRAMEEGQLNGTVYPGLLSEEPEPKDNKIHPDESIK